MAERVRDSREMASYDPQQFEFEEPPPRPTTPPVRRGFLLVLFVLCVMAIIVYGGRYLAYNIGYAWESGRSQAASEALAKLDKQGIVARASELFRMASTAVSPAVVNVQSLRFRHDREGFPAAAFGGNRMVPSLRGAELGSGVIIDKDRGYIVTNNHVIKDADEILVRLGAGDDVPARLIGADPKSDLAVLQVKAPLSVQAEWGDSDHLDNGEWVLAIGSPMGFDHSVTAGIVSATERNDVKLTDYESFIQTDAAINPGNSGGPLIDLTGKVVGINTAIISKSGGYEGIGLAIPSSLARRVVESLIKEGKVVRGYLGVRILGLTAELGRKLKLPNNRGALIVDIQPGSPADRAGLKSGDVIIKMGERDVTDPASLRNLTAAMDVGLQVPVTFYRQGERQSLPVTIAELPPAPEVLASFGFRIRPTPGGHGDAASIEIDQVVTGSPAFRAGLRPGMRILAVGQAPVATPAQFEAAVAKIDLNGGLPLKVQSPDGRGGMVVVGGPSNSDQP
jgi:serine protease Do